MWIAKIDDGGCSIVRANDYINRVPGVVDFVVLVVRGSAADHDGSDDGLSGTKVHCWQSCTISSEVDYQENDSRGSAWGLVRASTTSQKARKPVVQCLLAKLGVSGQLTIRHSADYPAAIDPLQTTAHCVCYFELEKRFVYRP
jgi:hypothetical protein